MSKDKGLFSYVPESILNHKANVGRPKSSTDRGTLKKRRGTGDQSNQSRLTSQRPSANRSGGLNSPHGDNKVQFESVVVEDKPDGELGGRHNRSGSTEPLLTDSYSGESELEVFEAASDEIIQGHNMCGQNNRAIQDQTGYNPRSLNRIKFRREHELEEFNFGINFTQLK